MCLAWKRAAQDSKEQQECRRLLLLQFCRHIPVIDSQSMCQLYIPSTNSEDLNQIYDNTKKNDGIGVYTYIFYYYYITNVEHLIIGIPVIILQTNNYMLLLRQFYMD